MKSVSKREGIATNAFLLAFVQCITLCTGIVQTMILSRTLTKLEYGTYSQGLLIINFVMPFLILGLNNAITFFMGQINIDAQEYIGFIFFVICILGLTGAGIIVCLQNSIILYFKNSLLKGIMIFIAIRPLLQNLIAAYQTLYMANGLSKVIAIRNFLISITQIVIVALGAYLFKDIKWIFFLLVILDIVQIILFAEYFSKHKFKIRLKGKMNREKAMRIFSYAIPLAISAFIGTLTIYMDKLLIGKMMSTEDFALYSNMSKELPFSFIVSSFTTIVAPILVRLRTQNDGRDVVSIWKNYLEIGYRLTWILCGASIVCSRELLLLLYSDKYISGYSIFLVYLGVSALRFSYFGIILSSYGKTKLIMLFSMATLILNFLLNSILFNLIGIIGPAIASFLVIFSMNTMQLIYGCRLLKCSIWDVMKWKEVVLFLVELIVIGIIVFFVKEYIKIHWMLEMIIFAGIYVVLLFLLNRSKLYNNINNLNAHSIK